ncbi:uncharacterized protein LOC144473581 [Augochlora pura]
MDTENVKTESQNPKLYNWRMSYTTYRRQLQNACPGDIKLLKDYAGSIKAETKRIDDDGEEYETQLDRSDSMLESPKLKVWEEYKKLLLFKTTYKPQKDLQSLLTEITCYPRVLVKKPPVKSQPYRGGASSKRSIMRLENQKAILVADSNYVQFRNFKLNKLYKKTIKLQNITTSPAKFRIQSWPFRSYFNVVVKPIMEDSSVVPPGMVMKFIVSFYCNVTDEPEELLVVNVQDGKPVIIRLHAFKDPPVLLEQDHPREQVGYLRSIQRSSIASHPELGSSDSNEAEVYLRSVDTNTSTSSDSDDMGFKRTKIELFDCERSFVGEEVTVPMKFRNMGGEGRFFVISEIDWCSMYIEDVTEENLLKIPPFSFWPVYFKLKPQDEITFRMQFKPDSCGIHVDKLYILSDTCTMVALEIIGDGLLYEPNFIQLSNVSTSSLRNSTVDIVVLCSRRALAFASSRSPAGICQSLLCHVSPNLAVRVNRWQYCNITNSIFRLFFLNSDKSHGK